MTDEETDYATPPAPTGLLQFVERQTRDGGVRYILQQQWALPTGETRWRDVPLVLTSGDNKTRAVSC
jgi:hypothetical protein